MKSGREFQIAEAAAKKEQELKIRLLVELEEETALRTHVL